MVTRSRKRESSDASKDQNSTPTLPIGSDHDTSPQRVVAGAAAHMPPSLASGGIPPTGAKSPSPSEHSVSSGDRNTPPFADNRVSFGFPPWQPPRQRSVSVGGTFLPGAQSRLPPNHQGWPSQPDPSEKMAFMAAQIASLQEENGRLRRERDDLMDRARVINRIDSYQASHQPIGMAGNSQYKSHQPVSRPPTTLSSAQLARSGAQLARSGRDRKTLKYDLLSRFLEGVSNTKAAFEVEYVRGPKNIDDAVYEMATYQSYQDSRQRKTARPIKVSGASGSSSSCSSNSESGDEADDDRAARLQGPPPGKGHRQHGRPKNKPQELLTLSHVQSLKEDILKMNKDLIARVEKLEQCGQKGVVFANQGDGSGSVRPSTDGCFKCGEPDHYARECPKNKPSN